MQAILDLSPDVELTTFCRIWEELVHTLPILRTRIVQNKSARLLQLVVDEAIRWLEPFDLDEYLKGDKENIMGIGQQLTRYALVKGNRSCTFVWTMHHALYDQRSLSLVLNAANRIYQGKQTELAHHFQPFIKFIKDHDNVEMEIYWRTTLADCECTPFPALPPSVEQPVTNKVLEHRLPQMQQHKRLPNITKPTVIRAAWALIAGSMTNSKDVVFGTTVSGRNAPVAGIEAVPAPTIATIPVRINVNHEQRVSEFLELVQKQATEMIPFEQMGLHRISKLNADTQQACMFQILLVVQPHNADDTQNALGKWQLSDLNLPVNIYCLILEVQLGSNNTSTTVRASFESRSITPWVVEKLSKRLDFLIQQFEEADSQHMLSELDLITPCDLEQLWAWNRSVPATSEQSIPEILEERAQIKPMAPAVVSWDGELTYAELNRLNTQVAIRITKLGVTCGDIVPLCLEKSKWTIVAMMSVLKSGAVFLLLDIALPNNASGILCDMSRRLL